MADSAEALELRRLRTFLKENIPDALVSFNRKYPRVRPALAQTPAEKCRPAAHFVPLTAASNRAPAAPRPRSPRSPRPPHPDTRAPRSRSSISRARSSSKSSSLPRPRSRSPVVRTFINTANSFSPLSPDPEIQSLMPPFARKMVNVPAMDTAVPNETILNDGFITVKSTKRKGRGSPPSSPTPEAAGKARRTSENTRSDPSSAPTAAPAPAEGKKPRRPPPITIQDKASWTKISDKCKELKLHYTGARNTPSGIQVQVSTSDDHRRLTSLLRSNRLGYFTYALEEERLLRVVIRQIPVEITPDQISVSLKEQNFPIREVHRMYKHTTRAPYNMVLVFLDKSQEGKSIFNLSEVCGLTGITVEPPHKNRIPSQCHNCQLYGHSSRNCCFRARCVKCLDDHATKECPRTPGTPTPPSCVLCQQTGHTANYRGCPRAPRTKRPQPVRQATFPKVPVARPHIQPLMSLEAFPSLPGTSRAPVAPAPAPFAPLPPALAPPASLIKPKPVKAVPVPAAPATSALGFSLAGKEWFTQLLLVHEVQEIIAFNAVINSNKDLGLLNAITQFPGIAATIQRLVRASHSQN